MPDILLDEATSVVVGARGVSIHVDPTDQRARRLAASGGDLNPLSLILWSIALGLRDWQVVVDVGANYGEMLVGADLPQRAEVVAVEPNVRVLPYLRRTLAGAGIHARVVTAALGARAARGRPFAVDLEWSGLSALLGVGETPSARVETTSVRVTTLDAIVDADHPRSACIKIDVEGGELAVLSGASRTLAGSAPWAIMLEILHMPHATVARLADDRPLYLLDRRTRNLVRIAGGNADAVRDACESGWVYPQDALLLSCDLESIGR
jgi:FkbM family methyltransferase